MPRSAFTQALVTVVDDDPANLALMRAVLATAGFDRTRTFADPLAALDDLCEHEPDLILLDLHMPNISGLEFLRRMPGRQRGHGFIPVLVLTADDTVDAHKAALRAGANDFVTKPIDTDELLLRVQNLLSMRLSYQELLHHNAALARQLRTRMHFEERRAADRTRSIRATRDVIERGGPAIVFQPFVELMTSRTIGVEALSRFGTEPRRGPDEWFADAAADGLGAELELSAVRAALAQREQLHPSWILSLNLSPATLLRPEFARLAADTDVRGLAFEITEHHPIDDYDELCRVTGPLQARGALVAVDDAGAGHASLRHILKLHPDLIKLDISLVRDVDTDQVKRALADSIARFASRVGADIVAEGIETERELTTLRDIGVKCGQGYHIARPARPAALLDMWPAPAMA